MNARIHFSIETVARCRFASRKPLRAALLDARVRFYWKSVASETFQIRGAARPAFTEKVALAQPLELFEGFLSVRPNLGTF